MASVERQIIRICKAAREASRYLALADTEKKNDALEGMARALIKRVDYILDANAKDARNARAAGLPSAMIDRLLLNVKRIRSMADSISEIARLGDPVGEVLEFKKAPSGILIGKMRVPIGVILVIYESRPNVTSDCAALCLKSGNSVILRGGSEALNSNTAIYKTLKAALRGFPEGIINLITRPGRGIVRTLLRQSGYIDLVMPRGGESLISDVTRFSRIPVIKHYKGVCHTYVDKSCDLAMARRICMNAKVQRPAVCNAMETLLVHKDIADIFLPMIAKNLKSSGVEIRGCDRTRKILRDEDIRPAKEDDWYAEYLDLILSVKVVDGLDAAIAHITKYGSSHSDSIVTDDHSQALKFLKRIDSACVYVNASTRFTDGKEFGKGAEIGISTDKIHARGPMALEELTSYKYIIFGKGQIRG